MHQVRHNLAREEEEGEGGNLVYLPREFLRAQAVENFHFGPSFSK